MKYTFIVPPGTFFLDFIRLQFTGEEENQTTPLYNSLPPNVKVQTSQTSLFLKGPRAWIKRRAKRSCNKNSVIM